MAPALCGNLVRSKRYFLALGWTVVNILAFLSFLSTLLFTLMTSDRNNMNNGQQNYYNYNKNNNNEEGREDDEVEISVTSRAMAFTSLWIAVLSTIIGIYGTVVLGFVTPSNYYWCCRHTVHKTTPMILGVFMGGLLMYANLTLVCSVLFGEFKVRDYNQREDDREDEGGAGGRQNQSLANSSTAFSILCMFLTILYSGFAALVFTYSNDLIKENEEDERREALKPSDDESGNNMTGYIGSKFTIDSLQRTTAGSEVMGTQGYVQPTDSSSNY